MRAAAVAASIARRVLDREGLAPDAFAFTHDDLPTLVSTRRDAAPENLIDRSTKLYPGLIAVRRSAAAGDRAPGALRE